MQIKAYQKVYEAIREGILNGEYPVGTMLPPEPELEKMFSTSRTTIRKAISRLSEDGFIHVQQGRGTEVVSASSTLRYYKFHNVTGIQEIVSNSNRPLTLHSCYIDRIPATQDIAQALKLPENTTVYRIQRLLYNGDSPFSLMKNYVRMDVAPNLEQHTSQLQDLYSLLQEKYGVIFHTGTEHISAISAGFTESNLLKVEPGTSLLFCTRYANTKTVPMEYGQTCIRTDQYKLVVEMQGWPAQRTPTGVTK